MAVLCLHLTRWSPGNLSFGSSISHLLTLWKETRDYWFRGNGKREFYSGSRHVTVMVHGVKWPRLPMTRGEAGLSGNHCPQCSRRTVKTALCFVPVRFLLAANCLWCEILPTVPGPCVILLSWHLDVSIMSSVLVKRQEEQVTVVLHIPNAATL